MPTTRRLRPLVLLFALPLLAPADAIAAPKTKKPPKSQASKPQPAPPPTGKAAQAAKAKKSAPSKGNGKGKATKKGKNAKKKAQSKALTQLAKADYLKSLIGSSTYEFDEPIVLTPARPRLNAATYLFVRAYGPGFSDPAQGRDGLIRLGDGFKYYDGSYVIMRFQAAAQTQYLVDCTVSTVAHQEGKTPQLVVGVHDLDGAATTQDGHALRYIPAAPESRNLAVWIYGVDNGIELSRCEISPLK